MNNKTKLLSILLLSILLVIVLSNWLLNRDKNPSYSTWLWNAQVLETDMENTIQSINKMNIQSVYLQYSSRVSSESYKKFIAALQKSDVDVYALDGAPDWGITDHESTQQFLDWFSDFQADALENEQFKGIHLDIEPYLLEKWDQDQEEIIYHYQTLLLQLKDFATNMNTSFGVDIPFWFDQIKFDNKYGQGYLAQWIIQNTDETAIMAYRNFAEGENGIIDISTKEVEWAEQENKKIAIALEIEKTSEEHTSFYNKNKHTLFSEIKLVQDYYRNRISGIAIHSFESLYKLQ